MNWKYKYSLSGSRSNINQWRYFLLLLLSALPWVCLMHAWFKPQAKSDSSLSQKLGPLYRATFLCDKICRLLFSSFELYTVDLQDRECVSFLIQLQIIFRLKSIRQKIHSMRVLFSKAHFTICLLLFTFFQVIGFCISVEL